MEKKICFERYEKENLGSIMAMIGEDAIIWFDANDVEACLGYACKKEAIEKHIDQDDRKTLKYKDCAETALAKLWGINDIKDKVLISEATICQLIMESETPKAKEMKNWVFQEVIPSITRKGRQTFGWYGTRIPKEEYDLLKEKLNKLQKRIEELNDYDEIDRTIERIEKQRAEITKLTQSTRHELAETQERCQRLEKVLRDKKGAHKQSVAYHHMKEQDVYGVDLTGSIAWGQYKRRRRKG